MATSCQPVSWRVQALSTRNTPSILLAVGGDPVVLAEQESFGSDHPAAVEHQCPKGGGIAAEPGDQGLNWMDPWGSIRHADHMRSPHAPVTRPSHPGLRGSVSRGYRGWTVRPPERAGRFVLPASLSVQLVLKIEDSPVRPPEFVNGVQSGFAVLEGGCAPQYVEVALSPLGAYRLLGLPMHRLRDQLIDMNDVLGREVARLGEMVREQPTWPRRFGVLDRFLLDRLDTGPVIAREVAFAWDRLIATGGTLTIGDLQREIGWSHKHLIRRFTEQVGVTPKLAARMIRFEGVLDRMRREPRPDWARLAVETGYADQAHLIRDFGEFAGTTPGRLPGPTRAGG
jgi:AraC-like DNA-binding protein